MTDRCVICGAVIPEGRQVCPICEQKSEGKLKYTLIMDSAQAHETLKAVELLMRLKIDQPEEIPFALILDQKDFSKRRDLAGPLLKEAFRQMYRGRKPDEFKDAEWYRLYNLFQVLRYAIHEAEHPESTGVDSRKPLRLTDEPMPKCMWVRRKKPEVYGTDDFD